MGAYKTLVWLATFYMANKNVLLFSVESVRSFIHDGVTYKYEVVWNSIASLFWHDDKYSNLSIVLGKT